MASEHPSWSRDGYVVTTDPARLDFEVVHNFLKDAYWSRGVPREVAERSIRNSLPFMLLEPDGGQCGFARVVSDRAVFAYLGDVFVLPAHRGRGLGLWLVECVLAHPELQGLRRWFLATVDAHGLYSRVGFGPMPRPEIHMVIEHAPHELWGSPEA